MGSLELGLTFILGLFLTAVVVYMIDSVLWLFKANRMYNKTLLSVLTLVVVMYVVIK